MSCGGLKYFKGGVANSTYLSATDGSTMATNTNTREQIIKDGYLKHRETGLVSRWRHRYIVFKISNAGRFVFTVYRDKPATPSNEITIVPLEEFGGLDYTLKLDGEKNVFAIITTGITECFAAETQETVHEWRTVIQEYLGKELVINVEVPHKQKFLKSGKAQMRIRNTGFTITSLDAPPKCMGTWLILHVRKFGGGDAFKFETGSKCPSGEYFYIIHSDEVKRIKDVFTDLSHHKPIFEDDRTGRRMTHEHRILKKMRERKQAVGPKLSLQNNRPPVYTNTPHQRFYHRSLSKQESVDLRSRSNAFITEPENQYSPLVSGTGPVTRTSPPTTNGIHHDQHEYYNLPEGGATKKLRIKGQTFDSSTSPVHETDAYYNRDAIERQIQLMSRHHTNSGSDSEDDFVDIKGITDETNISAYYNLRDNAMVKKTMLKRKSQPELPTYENYTPKHSGKYFHSANRHSDPDENFYTNFERISKTNTAKDTVVPTLAEQEDKDAESTVTEKQSLPESINNTALSASSKSLTDSEGSDNSTFRNRTTSIVEHVMISADQSTRSCEDLLDVDHKSWKKDKISQDGNHSDSELLDETSRVRRKSNFKTNDSEVGSDHEDYQPLTVPCPKSPNRINEYDHLELKDKRESSSSDAGDYIPLTGYLSPKQSDNKETDKVDEPLLLVKMPEDSKVMKSFLNRKHKEHLYEDVNVLEEERCLSSASSESPSSTPTHENRQKSYHRKVSLLGKEHCYESVVIEKSPSPPPPDSFPSKSRDRLLSPTRFSLKSNTNPSRPSIPTTSSANSSFDSDEPNPTTSLPAPSVIANHRSSRKPIPTPRQMMKNNVPTGSHQQLTSPVHSTTSRESAYVNGSVIQEQLNAIEKPVEKPVLPPKPRKYSSQQPEYSIPYKSSLLNRTETSTSFTSSDSYPQRTVQPILKTLTSLQEHPTAYAQIYVQTEPAFMSRDQSKLSQSRAEKKYPQTEYTKIDHFKTEQLHHLIEQRNIEKGLVDY